MSCLILTNPGIRIQQPRFDSTKDGKGIPVTWADTKANRGLIYAPPGSDLFLDLVRTETQLISALRVKEGRFSRDKDATTTTLTQIHPVENYIPPYVGQHTATPVLISTPRELFDVGRLWRADTNWELLEVLEEPLRGLCNQMIAESKIKF